MLGGLGLGQRMEADRSREREADRERERWGGDVERRGGDRERGGDGYLKGRNGGEFLVLVLCFCVFWSVGLRSGVWWMGWDGLLDLRSPFSQARFCYSFFSLPLSNN